MHNAACVTNDGWRRRTGSLNSNAGSISGITWYVLPVSYSKMASGRLMVTVQWGVLTTWAMRNSAATEHST